MSTIRHTHTTHPYQVSLLHMSNIRHTHTQHILTRFHYYICPPLDTHTQHLLTRFHYCICPPLDIHTQHILTRFHYYTCPPLDIHTTLACQVSLLVENARHCVAIKGGMVKINYFLNHNHSIVLYFHPCPTQHYNAESSWCCQAWTVTWRSSIVFISMFLIDIKALQGCITWCHEVLLSVFGSSFPWRWEAHHTKSEVIRQSFLKESSEY